MKRVGLLTLSATVLAQQKKPTSVIQFTTNPDIIRTIHTFCEDQTDAINCNFKLKKKKFEREVFSCVENYAKDETCDLSYIQAAADDEEKSSRVTEYQECQNELKKCMATVYDDTMTGQNTASSSFTMDEFLEGINDDAMLTTVLHDLNEVSSYIHQQKKAISAYNANGNKTEGLANAGRMMGPGGQMMMLGSPEQESSLNNAMETEVQLKRFVELKQLVSWLQPKDKRISRYCFYGCWCLPEGAHSFVAGEGRPVDLVDKACQYLWFCYTCAKQEMTGVFSGKQRICNPTTVKYTFRFKYDKKKPRYYPGRDILCKDKFYHPMNTKDKWKSNCAKAICECDRGLAMRLYKAWKHWDKSRHRIWSQKVTSCPQLDACQNLPTATVAQRNEKNSCLKRGCLFVVKRRCLNGDNGNTFVDHEQICCGKYTDDGSRFEMRDHGGTHACCNHDKGTGNEDGLPWQGTWFNTITGCCPNGKVEAAGGPNCIG